MSVYTGQWIVPWYPLTFVSCERDETLWMYHMKATAYTYGAPDRHADLWIPFYLIVSAKYPCDILSAAMIEVLERCGVPPHCSANLVKERIDYEAIVNPVIQRYIVACTGSLRRTSTLEPPSVICDQCSNAVHAVMEDGLLVFPVYTSTRFPMHQLCESCFTQTEQAGRAKVVVA